MHSSDVSVGRIQNFRAWSRAMVPNEHQASVGMEYFCQEGDGLWEMDDPALIRKAAGELERLGLARAAEAVDGTVIRQPKAYPVYDTEYREAVDVIARWLRGMENLQSVGRNGLHRYNNQDHSMLTAILAARNVAHALGARAGRRARGPRAARPVDRQRRARLPRGVPAPRPRTAHGPTRPRRRMSRKAAAAAGQARARAVPGGKGRAPTRRTMARAPAPRRPGAPRPPRSTVSAASGRGGRAGLRYVTLRGGQLLQRQHNCMREWAGRIGRCPQKGPLDRGNWSNHRTGTAVGNTAVGCPDLGHDQSSKLGLSSSGVSNHPGNHVKPIGNRAPSLGVKSES